MLSKNKTKQKGSSITMQKMHTQYYKHGLSNTFGSSLSLLS